MRTQILTGKLSLHPSISPPIHPSVYPSPVLLAIHLSFLPFVYLPIHLPSVLPSTCLSIHASINCAPICLPCLVLIHLPIHLSTVPLSMCRSFLPFIHPFTLLLSLPFFYPPNAYQESSPGTIAPGPRTSGRPRNASLLESSSRRGHCLSRGRGRIGWIWVFSNLCTPAPI